MAKGDDRAVVGSSGRALKGMVLESGARTIAKVLGRNDAPSGPKTGQRKLCMTGGNFDVDGMRDVSIGRAPDPSAK